MQVEGKNKSKRLDRSKKKNLSQEEKKMQVEGKKKSKRRDRSKKNLSQEEKKDNFRKGGDILF